MTVRVFLCDDTASFSTLVTYWLDDSDDLEVVGVTSTVDALLAAAPEACPDVIVLDHLLGAANSADVAPNVREAVPGAALLLLSGMPREALAAAAEACGADGYVRKDADAEQFCAAVRAVAHKRSTPS